MLGSGCLSVSTITTVRWSYLEHKWVCDACEVVKDSGERERDQNIIILLYVMMEILTGSTSKFFFSGARRPLE